MQKHAFAAIVAMASLLVSTIGASSQPAKLIDHARAHVAHQKQFDSSAQVIAKAMVPTRDVIAAGTSPTILDVPGIPYSALVGLQPTGASGNLRKIPLCNIDLGTGFAVLCVTLVDQNGNAVSAGSGGGSSTSSGAVYPAPSSSPFPIAPAPGVTFLMAPAPGATFLFNPNPNASPLAVATPTLAVATPSAPYPLATPGVPYAIGTPQAPYPIGTPAAPFPVATPAVPYPLATPAAPYPVATVTALPLAIPTGGVPLGTPAPGSTLAPVNGGSPVTATNPDPLASAGSTAAPLLGSIKKTSYTFTTTPLAASSTYTGTWNDSTVDNVSTLSVSIAMTGGGNASFLLDTTDDPTQTNFATVTLNVATGTYYNPIYSIPNRYWRVRFTTGTTAQTAFSLTGTTSGVPQAVGPTLANRSYSQQTDGIHTASLATSSSNGDGTSFGPAVAAYKKTYNGATSDVDFYCNGTPTIINVSAAGTTQLVALVASKSIRVCGYSYSVGGTTPTVQFGYSTVSGCASGVTTFTGAFAPTTGSVVNSPPSNLASFVVPSSNALCLVVGGTTPSVQGFLTYVQY